MAERRMFAKSVIESDAFLDLPISARLLYFDLGMRGDDDGFVDSPKRVLRLIGASDDDLKILIAKQFLIAFESGVVVVRHWKIHNYLRSDRYKPTQYQREKSLLEEGIAGIYNLRLPVGIPDDNQWYTDGIHVGCIGKGSIGEGSIGEENKEEENSFCPEPPADAGTPNCNTVILLPLNDKTEYPISTEQAYKWADLYPAVDVIQQLRNMKGWLDANPSKRKTKKGILRFINGWLSREQDRPRKPSAQNGGSVFEQILREGQE